MKKEIIFDILAYFRLLNNAGIIHSDVHAEALQLALSQNIYNKSEVKKLLDDTLGEFREKTERGFAEAREERQQLLLEIRSIEVRFEKALNRYLYTTIGVLGSLTVLINTISTAILHAKL